MTHRLEFARVLSFTADVRRRAAMPNDRLGPLSRLNRRTVPRACRMDRRGRDRPRRRRRPRPRGRPDGVPVPRLDPGQPQAAEARRDAHAGLRLGSAGARSAADAVGRALPVRRRSPATASSATRSPTRRPAPPTSRLKGDLAESWQASPDHRVWTFKLRQGVKWQNVPPLNGRELVAADIKYCFEAYAKEGVQSFTFQEIEGIETPDKYTRAHPPQDAQRAVPAEPRRARHGHLLRARCSRRTAISRSA